MHLSILEACTEFLLPRAPHIHSSIGSTMYEEEAIHVSLFDIFLRQFSHS